jgi:hypothetical protein
MKTSRLRAALLVMSVLLGAALQLPSTLSAQAVTGASDDATLPRRGELRVGVLSVWNRWYERYASNGTVQPLGTDFNLDTVGVGQFENLGAVQSSIRSLAGLPGFMASLGTSRVQVRDNILSTPLSLELGLTNRISLSVMVPFVTATSNVNFVMNPTGHEPTLGFNPTLIARGALSADSAFLAQFANAAVLLNLAISRCAATPSGSGCAQLNANPAAPRELIINADSYAAGLAGVYGGRGAAGNLFVPIAGTAAQSAIEAKVAAYRAMYAAYGIAAITATGPLGAQAPLTAADMQTVLTDSTFGINAKPLATSVTRGIGDIEVGMKVNLFDSFHGSDSARLAPKGLNWRQSVGGIYRLGTGTLPSPADFTAIGTGDHQSDIELRTFTDLLYGPHFWISLVGSYTAQMADQLALRIPDSPTQVILASYRQETVKRHLGDVVDIQVNPHWVLNDYISLAGQYFYRHKSADAYTGTFTVSDLAGNVATLDAANLGIYSGASEHRLGIGATYSTVAAVAKHKSGLPFDISYFHYETTLGSLGRVPKIAVDQVTLRVYQRLFGR